MKMISNLSNKNRETIPHMPDVYLYENLEELLKRH